jgi:hypothetical protein
MHSSARRNRSTGLPPIRCSLTISAASSGFTCPYQTASGYTTTVGPCSHWSRQPDLLIRTLPAKPASLVNCCNCVCNSLFPSAVQEGRGAPAGRELWQTKTWRSKTGKGRSSGFAFWDWNLFSLHLDKRKGRTRIVCTVSRLRPQPGTSAAAAGEFPTIVPICPAQSAKMKA